MEKSGGRPEARASFRIPRQPKGGYAARVDLRLRRQRDRHRDRIRNVNPIAVGDADRLGNISPRSPPSSTAPRLPAQAGDAAQVEPSC